MTSARRLYRVGFGLMFLGAGLTVAAIGAAVGALEISGPSANIATACRRLLDPGAPAALAVIALLALAAVVATKGLRSTYDQIRLQRAFVSSLGEARPARVAGVRVRLVASDEPLAFCAGMLKPRIYLSSRALAVLSDEETRAVVAHELHHCGRRDPLRFVVARVAGDALFFLPALRRVGQRYAALAELAADEAAAAATHRRTLASALLRFGASEPGAPVVGIAPERVDHLCGAPARWEVPMSAIAGSLAVASGLAALVTTVGVGTLGTSVGVPAVLSELCMLSMTLGPIALAGGALALTPRAMQTPR